LLAALKPSAIHSSDLARATMTAAPLARLTGLTAMSDKDLRERYGGPWEGLTDTEIRARYPVAHSQWRPPAADPPPPPPGRAPPPPRAACPGGPAAGQRGGCAPRACAAPPRNSGA